ncbi:MULTISPECIES: ABC transporter ATP-binding protein [Mesorhizobium]|uniref:ABC transporter ATP-binding protein n=1 Tax=Mesorhizobium denitrificans TaxID=2294114 RepID=A0A371X974_9HYPH|nr:MULTISPECIES: ABC transporter ATP-binding protein [Mesorhizobium]RFC65763.1 ABC transporter ATP-binding protein [Mesorhizobium denitrificans]
MTQAQSAQKKAGLAEVWRFARDFWKRSGKRAWIALGYLLLASVVDGVSILMLIPLLGFASGGLDGTVINIPALSFLSGGTLKIGPALVFLAVLLVLQAWFQRLRSAHMGELLFDYVARERTSLFESLSRARWDVFSAIRTSDAEHALTTETDRVQGAGFCVLMLAQTLVLLAVYVASSFFVSVPMTAFACVVGVVVFAVLQPVRTQAMKHGARVGKNRKQMHGTISQLVDGMKIAKVLNVETQFTDRVKSIQAEARAQDREYVLATTNSTALFNVFAGLVLCVFVYAALEVFRLSLAETIVLLLLFTRIFSRFRELQTYIQQLLAVLPAVQAIASMRGELERCAESEEVQQPAWIGELAAPSVQLRNVTFAYSADSERAALKDVSFDMPAGKVTALIGESGAGKSTVAEILLGLQMPQAGEMLIGGRPLLVQEGRAWRNRVAYVPQDVFLFDDTVANNLRLAAPQASDEQIWSALKQAGADNFVRQMPRGLETEIGARGIRMSGGERQRIALARALIRKPALLILDEATSALDWRHQSLISETIMALRGDMTILTIAHRPSMIAFADHVVALHAGEVAESGAYAALTKLPQSRLSRMLSAESAAA